ncbi:MAG: AAA family ATPase [Burkholderiales bacterium]
MGNEKSELESAKLVQALRDPRCYPHAVKNIRLIETHISYVLLTGEYAYKLKKPVNLGFLDFSTIAARRNACDEEVRLNRRTAARIYLAVVPITGHADAPVIAGDGDPIDYAVKMREFPEDSLMVDRLMHGVLTPADVDALSAQLAIFHEEVARSTVGDRYGTPAGIRARVREAFDPAVSTDPVWQERIDALHEWVEREGARMADVMARRKADGFVRECHGDLHLANIAMIEGMPVPFDCIEFNADLRWGDVMGEVAFTFMDFLAHGRSDFGWRFLNGYLEQTGDYDGAVLLRIYAVYRALVRSKVAGIRAHQSAIASPDRAQAMETSMRYRALALQLAESPTPVLALMRGLSGSGKSTVASMAAESIGAIRVRSDVERKRLFDLAAAARSASPLGTGLYGPDATRKTYARLADVARTLLAAGLSVIVDATSLACTDRAAFRAIAEATGARFIILDCVAPVEVLRARIADRRQLGADASEADDRVLEHQLLHADPLDANEARSAIRIATDCAFRELEARCALLPMQVRESGHHNAA